jgi:hypothetical protein
VAKYPPTKRRAAKHPPTDNQRDLDDVEKTKRRQVQKWILFEKRIQPPPAKSFQDNASREGAMRKAPSLSDQNGLGFHLESSPKRRAYGERVTPSTR